jgi:hypothetical protein
VRKVVVSLCDRTGNMVKPWAEAGFECWCVDIQHSIRRPRVDGNIHYVWGDVRSWRPPESIRGRIAIIFGFPPCTHLASSGARDHLTKSGWALADALQVFDSCEVAGAYSGVPFMIENPRGRLSTHRRKPDYSFQPWQYGDLWFKETCLWTGNGFNMPLPTNTRPPEGTTEKIWLMPPSDDRANMRSETPPRFAQAVFESNCPGIICHLDHLTQETL